MTPPIRHIAVSGPVKISPAEMTRFYEHFSANVTHDDFVYCGGAFGLDTEAAVAARAIGARLVLIVPLKLRWNKGLRRIASEVFEVDGSYMDRNDVLAGSTAESLLAYPHGASEVLRSGTWATIRRFRKRDKPVTITPLSG